MRIYSVKKLHFLKNVRLDKVPVVVVVFSADIIFNLNLNLVKRSVTSKW